MQRAFTNILSGDVDRTARFYQDLLGMTRHYDSDWFVILTHAEMAGLEFGILDRHNAIVPEAHRASPQGIMLTFVVRDLEPVHDKARLLDADIVEAPTTMPYGQRRMLIKDPDGTLVDISAPIKTP